MFIPKHHLRDLFPVDGFDINTDHDYFQRLFTDPSLEEEREKFLDVIDKIWTGLELNVTSVY